MINGATIAVGAITKTLAPMIIGPLFSFGLRLGYVAVPFYSLIGTALMALILSLWLKRKA